MTRLNRLPPGRYQCPKCHRQVTLLVASMALCVPCGRRMRPVSPPLADSGDTANVASEQDYRL